MVTDQYRLTHLILGTQPARRVGQHHGGHTRCRSRPDRMHHMLQVVTLIGVDAPGQHQHAVTPEAHRVHQAAVAGRGRRGEAGEIGHRHRCHRLAQLGYRGCPTRSEHHRDIVVFDAGPFGDGGGCLAGCLGIGHDRRA